MADIKIAIHDGTQLYSLVGVRVAVVEQVFYLLLKTLPESPFV